MIVPFGEDGVQARKGFQRRDIHLIDLIERNLAQPDRCRNRSRRIWRVHRGIS